MKKANPDWGFRIAEWRRRAGLLPGLVLLVPAYGLLGWVYGRLDG